MKAVRVSFPSMIAFLFLIQQLIDVHSAQAQRTIVQATGSNLGAPEVVLILIVVLGIALVPGIFFLLTLQKALERCSPENRTMAPGEVWLLLIPLFNIVWQFIIVSRIASSLANEFRRRNIASEPEPGKSIGLAFCVLNLCSIIPFVGIVTAIAGLVCWIVYWVKVANYSAQLAFPFAAPGSSSL